MEKSDLKTGMRVKTRDGQIFVCLVDYGGDGHLRFFDHTGERLCFLNKEVLTNDLKNGGVMGHILDIVAVYAAPDRVESIFDFTESGRLLWERDEKVELTLDEIADRFGISVKNLKIKK